MLLRSAIEDATAPNRADILASLDRVLASPGFRASPRLSSFLRFVVEETVAGRGNRIKGYTVAVVALGRSESFDPQTDPIVRVEAGRLRRALERYYAGPGSDDEIVITLPRGSYIPSFGRRTFGKGAPPPHPNGRTIPRLTWRQARPVISGACLATAVIAALYFVIAAPGQQIGSSSIGIHALAGLYGRGLMALSVATAACVAAWWSSHH
jgi:hypothetical protein